MKLRGAHGSTLVPLLFALAFAACGDPPKSLRTLMLQQELYVRGLEEHGATMEPAELTKEAERVLAISADAAFQRYETRSTVKNRVSEFRALRERYVAESEALATTARSADREGLVSALTRLRGTCDGCHAQFRPGL